MGILERLEAFFERLVEGIFKRGFRGGMQPIEIGKALNREMEAKRTISISRIYVPNYYIVRLPQGELEKITPIRMTLIKELSEHLTREARKYGYSFTGELSISFEEITDKARAGELMVESKFVENASYNFDVEEDAESMESDESSSYEMEDTEGIRDAEEIPESTIVAQRIKEGEPLLTVIHGNDEGSSFRIKMDAETIHIGRKETNEICLHDLNVSRVHAVIQKVAGEFIIRDLESKNGTFLNDERISEDLLKDGDIIRMGTTALRFKLTSKKE